LPSDDRDDINFLHFPYDWRRSNIEAAYKLKAEIDRRLPKRREQTYNPDAKAILIAHSMGGLVARYYLEVLQGWRDCRALITFGTPFGGSVNAIGYLANGYKMAGIVDLTDALRLMPSVYELMTRYPAVLKDGQHYRIGEMTGIPDVCPKRASIALECFYKEIDQKIEANKQNGEYQAQRYKIFPYIGIEQPTWQSAELRDGRLELLRDWPPIVPETKRGGDGTVPRASATPPELSEDYRETFFIQKHAALQNYDYALVDLAERLKQMQAPGKPILGSAWTPRRGISLEIDDFYAVGEPVGLRARLSWGPPDEPLEATVERLTEPLWRKKAPVPRVGDGYALTLGELEPGRYNVSLRSKAGGQRAGSAATEVSDMFEVGV
jgi:pimeloyl-ACP methyl ester carboxylesterase